MNRENVKSLFGVIGILVLAIVLWFYINRELASVLVGLLFGRLIDQLPMFGKKDGSQLALRGSLLTAPLQNIYGVLDFGVSNAEQAVQSFTFEIDHKALLETLKQDAPDLVKAILELKGLVEKIAKAPYTSDEAKRMLGGEEFEKQKTLGFKYVDAAVRWERIAESSEIQVLVSQIKDQIQHLIAKYAGG